MVKLLLRAYDPDAGVVRIGGHDIRNLHPDDIFDHIAVVNQDAFLFHGTVRENLLFGRPGASDAQIEASARAANVHEFVARLPHGYDTVIGERGIRLSGGQRQRIAIARALLKDAPILVLDEALSAVDAENEAVIQEALERLMQGRTTLILAHRLSSVINADRLLVLDDGELVETGGHAELMARRGIYHALMAAQAEESGHDNAIGFESTGEEEVDLVPEIAASAGTDLDPPDSILRAEGLGWSGVLGALFAYVAPWRGRLVLTFLFGVARVLALIGVGVLSALAVAAVKAGAPYAHYLWWLAAVAPLAGILHWLESWVAHDMAFRMLAEMRVSLYHKLDALAPAYLVRRRSGDLVAMATHDVELVEYFFAHTVAPAFVAILVPLMVLGTLIHFCWPLALALSPFLVVVAASPLFLRRRIDELGSRAREALAEVNAHVVDTIQGLSEIICFQQRDVRGHGFRERIGRHERLRLPFFRELTRQTSLLEVATGLGGLAVVATGAHYAGTGQLNEAILPLLTLLALSAFLPVSEIAHVGLQLADTLGATRRLHAVESEPVTVRSGPSSMPTLNPAGTALAMEGVQFTYLGRTQPALDDVGFEVKAGTTVALVGPSGAGKTTVAHLFLRFWDPQAGTVRVYGEDIASLDLEPLRQHIALVTQETYLFNDTLRANMAMAKPDASDGDLAWAVERASLGEFVASLPDGLETRVGERGVRLSGGQRQRVAIARAFLKDAPILILDEATSHLDAVNEQAVRNALAELMVDRTTVVIAHRLSTVRDADQIVVLEQGRVAEMGRHEALFARGGLYSRLVRRQVAGAASSEPRSAMGGTD